MPSAYRCPTTPRPSCSEMPHTNELVFPGRSGKRLSAPIFERILKRLEMPGTPHGIRSAFAGWAAERGTALEVIDASLAHRIGTAVTRAYVRGLFKLSFAQIAGKTKVRASSGGCWLILSNATNVKPETSYRASSASSKSTAHPKTQIGKPSSTRNGADLSQQLAVRGRISRPPEVLLEFVRDFVAEREKGSHRSDHAVLQPLHQTKRWGRRQLKGLKGRENTHVQ